MRLLGESKLSIRKDIQALRALAVMAVFVYHMRPGYLTGGFVGVDIFFVLSGFLISSHLIHELQRDGKISFSKFWARRARRLLPASLTVLLASAIGVWLLAPTALQERFYRDISAATVYVANWVFAFDSVDYLAAENSPSVVQHFWSLGVEEQLYLAWPLILAAAWLIGSKFLKAQLSLAITLSVIAAASLFYSAALVFDNNPIAYFSTFSRAWEFASGALLALWMVSRKAESQASNGVRLAAAWAGWLSIAGFMFFFEASAGFPGLNAVIPVVATVLIIWANDPTGALSPKPILDLKPIQFLGDASYSIYLWHWPILIFVGFNYSTIPARVLPIIFLVTLALSWLSLRFVENPFRKGRLVKALPPKRTFIALAAGMAVLVASSQSASAVVMQQIANERSASQTIEEELARTLEAQLAQADGDVVQAKVWDQISCMGPAFMVEPECASFVWDTVVPGVAVKEETAHDVEPLYRIGSEKGCLAWGDDYSMIECVYGVEGGTRMALIGDSHAYHWLPAFAKMAKQNNIELHFVARAGCPANELPRQASGDHVRGCFSWQQEMQTWMTESPKFETVVISNFSGTRFEGAGDYGARHDASIEGYKQAWQPIINTGTELVVMHDTPFIGQDAWECVVNYAEDMSRCDSTLAEIESNYDDSAAAATELELRTIDFTKYFCQQEMCPMAIGGIRVYRDSNHMSGTFNLLMTPYLRQELLGE